MLAFETIPLLGLFKNKLSMRSTCDIKCSHNKEASFLGKVFPYSCYGLKCDLVIKNCFCFLDNYFQIVKVHED